MFGFFFLLTQFLQFVRGYSPLDAGVATLPLAFTLVLVSPRSVALAARFGVTSVVTVGFAFIVAGFALMATVDASTPYLVIAMSLVLTGIGMGVTTAPATGSIMSAVPLNKAGVGSAVNDTTREVGGALGIAVLGSIANSVYRSVSAPTRSRSCRPRPRTRPVNRSAPRSALPHSCPATPLHCWRPKHRTPSATRSARHSDRRRSSPRSSA